MKDAEKWVLREIAGLNFKPYGQFLPRVEEAYAELRIIETEFLLNVGSRLTKRQAVALGLLARTHQLAIACLTSQLLQNHAGWTCSYRSLLETFFALDWLLQTPQRLDAYFEGARPSSGRIKNAACTRHPDLVGPYDKASEVTHVGDVALHLPHGSAPGQHPGMPFVATTMGIAGPMLAGMMGDFTDILERTLRHLRDLLLAKLAALSEGEVMWDAGKVKAKFGCLGYVPRTAAEGVDD